MLVTAVRRSGRCELGSGRRRERSFAAPPHLAPKRGIHYQRLNPVFTHVDESAVVFNPAIAK